MRVIPLTSLLSHKGRGCRSPKQADSLSLEGKKSIEQSETNYPISIDAVTIDSTTHRCDCPGSDAPASRERVILTRGVSFVNNGRNTLILQRQLV